MKIFPIFIFSSILIIFILAFILAQDSTPPQINFVYPTPNDGMLWNLNSVYINVSSTDDSNHSVWIDWDASLVGYWGMDSLLSNGSVYDNSSYGNNGILYNHANTTINGKRGQSISLDGVDNYIDITDSDDDRFDYQAFTISLWANRQGAGEGLFPGLVGNGNAYGYFLIWRDTNEIRAYVRPSGGSLLYRESVALDDDTWYHIAMVYNSSDVNLYIDGILVNSTSCSAIDYSTETYSLKIGRYDSATPDYFNGSLDEVLLFNRSLSQDEINSLYNASSYQFKRNFTNLDERTYNYTIYSIDDEGNSDNSNKRSVVVDFNCGYSYGNYIVDCSDNCTISSNTDIGGNNISIVGAGTFTMTANISGVSNMVVKGTDSSNLCTIYCKDGGCFV